MKYLTPIPKQFVDQSGIPYSGGTVSVYLSGSDELTDIFADAEGEALIPNPCMLDSNGAWQCFVPGNVPLDYIVQDKHGNVVFSYYDILPPSSGSGTPVSVEGTVGEITVTENEESGVRHFVVSLATTVKDTITMLIVGMNSVVNSLGNKADKVQGATAGNLASLDSNGNLADSGSKVGDFKTKQTAVPDPSASGTGLEFISSVSQNANGEVATSKKSVQDGTTAQKGVVKLNNAIDSSSTTEAATPKAVKDAYDALNNKIIARATFLSQAEWAVQSQLPGDPAKVYYVENGTGEDAFTVYVWNTDTNTYVEVDESSISLDGYWHDSPTTTGDGNVVTSVTLGNNGVPQIVKGLTALTQHQDISGKLDKNGDASNTTSTFTIASSRTNISSGEKLSTLFGKIAKWFSDLKAVAFSGSYSDLSDKPTIPAAAKDGVLTIKQNGTSKGTFSANQSSDTEINVTDTTYESKSASLGGTDVSLVTTGEKYNWNDKQDALPKTGNIYDIDISGRSGSVLLPRNPESDYNLLCVGNRFTLAEMGPDTSNRPSDHWYHVSTCVGSDSSYATQVATCMTELKSYYRIKNAGTWSAWRSFCLVQSQVGSTRLPIYVNADGTLSPINIDEYYCWAQPTLQWNDVMEVTLYNVQNQCNNEILGSVRSINLTSNHPSLCYLRVNLPELQGAGRYRFTLEFEITNSSGINVNDAYGVLILVPPTGYSGEEFLAECVYYSSGKPQSSVMNQFHVPQLGQTTRHKLYVDGHTYRVVKTK